jgi:hypothetical protein
MTTTNNIPSPWALDHADHRLPAGMHIDVFRGSAAVSDHHLSA